MRPSAPAMKEAGLKARQAATRPSAFAMKEAELKAKAEADASATYAKLQETQRQLAILMQQRQAQKQCEGLILGKSYP